jgi:hypothetical protein
MLQALAQDGLGARVAAAQLRGGRDPSAAVCLALADLTRLAPPLDAAAQVATAHLEATTRPERLGPEDPVPGYPIEALRLLGAWVGRIATKPLLGISNGK